MQQTKLMIINVYNNFFGDMGSYHVTRWLITIYFIKLPFQELIIRKHNKINTERPLEIIHTFIETSDIYSTNKETENSKYGNSPRFLIPIHLIMLN